MRIFYGRAMGGDRQCDVLADGCPSPSRRGAHPFAGTVCCEQPFHNVSNELERFELWKYQFGRRPGCVHSAVCARGERACLRGRQLRAGSGGLRCVRGAGGIRGTWGAVTPSETQALLVAGAVRQGGGTGMDWAEVSCLVQIFQTVNLLPYPRGVICIYKLVLCSVPRKCKLICYFP